MNSVDIRHFVDINIVNRKAQSKVNSTRETVALFTLDDKFAPDTGDTGYAEYSSLDEVESVEGFVDADKAKAIYKYCKVYFDNGGVKLRLINPNYGNTGTALTEITYGSVLPFVKELPEEIICVAVVNTTIANNITTICGLADAYNSSTINGFTVYGVNEKYFLGNLLYTTSPLPSDLDTHKNVAIKLIDQTYQVGGEMTIAAYLSQVDVYKSNSIKDYAFTPEVLDTTHFPEDMNAYVKTAIDSSLNITVDAMGARNIGGNLVTGEDLINKYCLIILHQTLSQRAFNILTQKLKGNDCVTALYAEMSRELNRYVSSGYLTTDKVWDKDDLTVVKKRVTYTLITKGTALVQGYKITVLPFASLEESEIAQHKLPYIYVILADSYNVRKATIYGETI